MPWVKGQSGNISGKAKDYNGIQDGRAPFALSSICSRIVRDKTPPAARVSARVALMDRAYGKPAASAPRAGTSGGQSIYDDELIRIAAEAGLKLVAQAVDGGQTRQNPSLSRQRATRAKGIAHVNPRSATPSVTQLVELRAINLISLSNLPRACDNDPRHALHISCASHHHCRSAHHQHANCLRL
jgi:hypothetical protein